ncbi:MAG: hypothetical protein GWN58_42060, partial [Anaerolineae bacterium]|nr:hypothetical protein [Anaerolineae bacterium]
MAQPTTRQVHLDTAMTNISIAYRNDNYIAEQVFPVVPVQHQSDKYFVFDKASWFRNEAGVRAPGTRGPEVEYSVSSSTYACVPVSATKVVPDEMVRNADQPLQPRREATEFVTDKVLLYLEEDVANNYIFGNNWTASGAGGTSSGSLRWDNDLSDPIGDVETAKEHIVSAIGREPNVMVMGRQVWTALANHPDMLDKIKYTSPGIVTQAMLPNLFQIPRVLIGNAIYTTSLEGATASYSYIWGKTVWLGWVPP